MFCGCAAQAQAVCCSLAAHPPPSNPYFHPSSLHLVLRLRGGGGKRKKKTYTKPKKIKHVHKTFKLAALKFYSVSDDGKVKLLRKECPKCGAGVFMATHFDRYSCGKCGLRVDFDALEDDE